MSGDSHQRRLLRRLYERSPFSSVKPERETFKTWWARSSTKWELIAAAVFAWVGLEHRPFTAAMCISVVLFIFFSDFFGGKWVKEHCSRRTRILFFTTVFLLSSSCAFREANWYYWAHTPWCYGFFFSPPNPNGWIGGWAVHFGVAAANLDGAQNVSVELIDTTGNSGDYDSSKIYSPPTIAYIESSQGGRESQVFTPFDHPYLAGAYDTGLSFDGRKLVGSTFDATIKTSNGIDIREAISLNGEQCMSVMRVTDDEIIADRWMPQFDAFGGRMATGPCEPRRIPRLQKILNTIIGRPLSVPIEQRRMTL